MIKLFILDDHTLFAQSLASLLLQERQDFDIQFFDKSAGVMAAIQTHNPAIILLDINLQEEINGIQFCKTILNKYPNKLIIALSMFHEKRHILGMKKAGAKGYLIKNTSKEKILLAIDTVLEGKNYFNEVDFVLTNDDFKSETIDLNPREKKILECLMIGQTSKAIAQQLNVSIKTIEFYRSSLLIKFNAKNVVELINKAKDYLG